jgi:hypothetical protein
MLRAKSTIAVVVIACGRDYLSYTQTLLKGINNYFLRDSEVEVLVFTDQEPPEISIFDHIVLRYISIPKMSWPQASFMRYSLIDEYSDIFSAEYIIYMDADLEVVSEISFLELFMKDFFCVLHPGYYNRNPFFIFLRKFYHPPWEISKKFSSRIPLIKRKIYVAGGIWGGKTNSVLSLARELASITKIDVEHNLFPRSYDESYLNWWVLKNKNIVFLSPQYLYANYKWLANIDLPKILAVTKQGDIVTYKIERNKLFLNKD